MEKLIGFKDSFFVCEKYKAGIFLLALVYAIVLVSCIPLDGSIKDRSNYLGYAAHSDLIFLGNVANGILTAFSNEPVWLAINISLSVFFSPEVTLSIIIFFSAFVTSYMILEVNKKYFVFLVLLLFFPQVIGKFVVHLRQGLAISFFLLGWLSSIKSRRLFFIGLTPFIHSSFFFVILLYWATKIMRRSKLSVDIRILLVVAIGLAVSFGLEFFGSLLSARQVAESKEVGFSAADVTGLGFLFWVFLLFVYLSQGRSYVNNNDFVISVIVFYLTAYFLVKFSGRIFESTVVLVFLAGLGLELKRRVVFFVTVFTFVGLTWLLRIDQPWLGWGTGS